MERWKIEEIKGGQFYVVANDGTRLCRVYGLRKQKIQLAEAIANLPLLADAVRNKNSQWKIVGIESDKHNN